MLFCFGEGYTAQQGAGYQKNNCIFNVQVTPKEWDVAYQSIPVIKIPLNQWVYTEKMTDKEKKDWPCYKTTEGYLKVNTYQDAWKIWWDEASESDRQSIINLIHFNAEIFKKITSIDLSGYVRTDVKKQELLDKAEELILKANEL